MAVFSPGLNRVLSRDDLTLKASGAEVASTTGSATELGDKAAMNLKIDITAFSGTPTMLLFIEGSDDLITWYTIARVGKNGYILGDIGTDPTNFDGTDTQWVSIPAARYVRYRSVIGGGSPSLTYVIAGTSV